MHCTDGVLWNFSLETYIILLPNITPINLIKFENKNYNFLLFANYKMFHLGNPNRSSLKTKTGKIISEPNNKVGNKISKNQQCILSNDSLPSVMYAHLP